MSGFKFCFLDNIKPSDIKIDETSENDESKLIKIEESSEKDEIKLTKKEETSNEEKPQVLITEWFEATEIFPSNKIIENLDTIFVKANMFIYEDIEIGHVRTDEAVKYLKEIEAKSLGDNVLVAESQHSDLLEGKYEGGLKIWECTMDLVQYIYTVEKIVWEKSKVLDLGCGAGILGLVALMENAEVHFQDYNKEVINAFTIPNVLLNITEEERGSIKTNCKFFAGDWESLDTLMNIKLEDHQYDYILSSETIYNVANHQKLYAVIKNHLKKTGTAYLAAKTYYFGVGGSTREFEILVNNDGVMKYELCWNSVGGVSREIIKLTFN